MQAGEASKKGRARNAEMQCTYVYVPALTLMTTRARLMSGSDSTAAWMDLKFPAAGFLSTTSEYEGNARASACWNVLCRRPPMYRTHSMNCRSIISPRVAFTGNSGGGSPAPAPAPRPGRSPRECPATPHVDVGARSTMAATAMQAKNRARGTPIPVPRRPAELRGERGSWRAVAGVSRWCGGGGGEDVGENLRKKGARSRARREQKGNGGVATVHELRSTFGTLASVAPGAWRRAPPNAASAQRRRTPAVCMCSSLFSIVRRARGGDGDFRAELVSARELLAR